MAATFLPMAKLWGTFTDDPDTGIQMPEDQFTLVVSSGVPNHSYLTVRREPRSPVLRRLHETSVWRHWSLPARILSGKPASWTVDLQLKCPPREDVEECITATQVAERHNLSVQQFRKAVQALTDENV